MNRLTSHFVVAAIVMACALSAFSQPASSRHYNERHVMRALRQIGSGQATYQATTGNGNYASLADLNNAGFVDAALASGDKYGYVFTVSTVPFVPGGSAASFAVTATPRVYRRTGSRSFFLDQSGEIRGGDKNGQPANGSDPVIDDCTSGAIEENERCTIADMRQLAGAQATYATTFGGGNFGSLNQLYSAGLIRSDFADNLARGYVYKVQLTQAAPPETPARFKIWATPQIYGVTAIRSYYLDETGVVRGGDKNGGQANENDPQIKQ
jgi:hypothetical protein